MHWRPAAKPLTLERTRSMTTSTISIDGRRLWQSLMDLAQIGATPKGGNCRLALTALDGQGRDLVVGWMKEAGLSVRSEEHTSELQSLMRISYAVFCLQKQKTPETQQ